MLQASVGAPVKCYCFLGSPLLSHTRNRHYSISSDGAHVTPKRQSPNTFAGGFRVALAAQSRVHTRLHGCVSSALEHPPPLPSQAPRVACFLIQPAASGSGVPSAWGQAAEASTVPPSRATWTFYLPASGAVAVSCQTGTAPPAPPAAAAQRLCCHSTRGISAESDNTSAH